MAGVKGLQAKQARVRVIFERLRESHPAPSTELAYGNAYQLLVAVVLSAQMTDKGVNKATKPLFDVVKTPAEMLALGEAGVLGYIKSINYCNAKARNVMGLSARLMEVFGGEVPRSREDLESLPGVGRKTANVVLNCLWGEAVMPVDTHVFRVAHRLGLSKGKKPLDVERDLLKLIPAEFGKDAHHWLILHGRYTCTARAPKCGECGVAEVCPWVGKKVS
ncbi:MAG: endonuclease III [Alphaproteobacteria bacterium]